MTYKQRQKTLQAISHFSQALSFKFFSPEIKKWRDVSRWISCWRTYHVNVAALNFHEKIIKGVLYNLILLPCVILLCSIVTLCNIVMLLPCIILLPCVLYNLILLPNLRLLPCVKKSTISFPSQNFHCKRTKPLKHKTYKSKNMSSLSKSVTVKVKHWNTLHRFVK